MTLSYAYNPTGTVANVTSSVGGVNGQDQYQYDPLKRLTSSTLSIGGSTTTLTYQYDNLGNRISQNSNGTQTSFAYNVVNGLTQSCTVPSGSSCASSGTYGYDFNGNLVSQTATSSTTTHWSYSWDPAGNLVQVSNDTGVQGQYAYDGSGRRVVSTEDSSTIYYSYAGTNVLSQSDLTGTSTDYISANGITIARIDSGSTVSYSHTDALGSTRMITDATGQVIFSDSYLPYGQDNGTPNGSETYKFTGKPVSPTTGLYYEYQRWYDPSTGRFISQDPLPGHARNPQSLNPYVYVLNQPTRLTDPAGMDIAEGGLCGGDRCGGAGLVNTASFWENVENLPQIEIDTSVTTGSLTPAQAAASASSEDISNVGLFVNRVEFETFGPSSEEAGTFGSGGFKRVVFDGQTVFRQYANGQAEFRGRFATSGDYHSSTEAINKLSLPTDNRATSVRDVVPVEGAVGYAGEVGPKFGRYGGGFQILVANQYVYQAGTWRPILPEVVLEA